MNCRPVLGFDIFSEATSLSVSLNRVLAGYYDYEFFCAKMLATDSGEKIITTLTIECIAHSLDST